MSLDFLPRKLHQRTVRKTEKTHDEVGLEDSKGLLRASKDIKGKQKAAAEVISDETIATCLKLAFSDYTLQRDDGIRGILANLDGDEYMPLAQLISDSSYLSSLAAIPQLRVVRILRGMFPDLDVRMCVSDPSTSRDSDPGGYELRSPGWLTGIADQWKEDYWESRTIYIENIPHQYRTVSAIHDFLQTVSLGTKPLDIQSITFPPHHLDKPGDIPRNKGFAFVVCSGTRETRDFCTLWTWQGQRKPVNPIGNEAVYQEACVTGFRSLPLPQWNRLRDEYLAYQLELLDRVRNQSQPDDFRDLSPLTSKPNHAKAPADDSSSFPRGCLVFLKHIHPETNKSTLRKLLQRFTGSESIDYVDYQKGVDTCLVRFKFTENAQKFNHEITNKTIYQVSGLDDEGSELAGKAQNPIAAELLSGTREELYWENIPSQIREQCLIRQHRASETPQQEMDFRPEGNQFILVDASSNELQWFPKGCLLFIKNVHPETNKTTLRKLVTQGLHTENQTDLVDYVDYQKGLDSCYIRLRSSADTQALYNHLTTSCLRQCHGLDDKGSPSSKEGSVQVEVLTGRKEELYWEKIPEKIRLAALDKMNRGNDAEVELPKKKRRR